MSRHVRVLPTVALLLGAFAGASMAQVVPLGGPFDAASLPGRHESPVAVAGVDGSFRLLWEEPSKGVHEAIWDAAGMRRVPQFFGLGTKVSGDALLLADDTFPGGHGMGELQKRTAPHLTAPAEDGTFWAVWTERKRWVSAGPMFWSAQTLDEDVYTRRFTIEGRPLGLPVRVDQGGASFQRAARVVGRPGGGILAVWESGDASAELKPGDGVRVRALDERGVGFRVERSPDDGATTSRAPSVALSVDSERALVAWEGFVDPNEKIGVWSRLVDPQTGDLLGEPRRLDSGLERAQVQTWITPTADGGFLVVWQGSTNELVPGYSRLYHSRVLGRRVDADGHPVGAVMVISDGSFPINAAPKATLLGDGRVFVNWIAWHASSIRPAYVAGALIDEIGPGEQLALTTGQLAPQHGAALASNGDVVFIAWAGYDTNGKPTVHGQRFRVEEQ